MMMMMMMMIIIIIIIIIIDINSTTFKLYDYDSTPPCTVYHICTSVHIHMNVV